MSSSTFLRGLVSGIVIAFLSSRAQAIRVEIEPMPFSKAAGELSRLFGAQVRIDKRLQRTTFVAYAPSTTPEELRAKIAEAFNATWTHWNGEWLLEQTETQIRQESEAIERQYRSTVRRFLSFAQVTERRYEPFSENHARLIVERWDKFFEQPPPELPRRTQFFEDEDFFWIKRELPSGRLLNRVVAQLSEDDFTRVPIGQRKVFAWKPMGTSKNGSTQELQLSFDPSKLLTDYWTEQQLIREALEKEPPKEMAKGLMLRIGAVIEPENLVVTISRLNPILYEIRVAVIDKESRIGIDVYNYSYNMDLANGREEFDPNFWDFNRNREQLISIDARAFKKLLPWPDDLEDRSFVTYAEREPNANLVQQIKQASSYDPNSFRVWELLKMEAEDRKASFLGELSDENADSSYGLLRGAWNVQSAERNHDKRNIGGPWIRIRPSDPHWARKIFRDRLGLERFLSAKPTTGQYRNIVELAGAYAQANDLVKWNNPLDSLVQRVHFEDLPTDGKEPEYWPAYAEPGRQRPSWERWQPAFRNSAFWSRCYKEVAPLLPTIPAAAPTDIDVKDLRVPSKIRTLLEQVLFTSASPEDTLTLLLVRHGTDDESFFLSGDRADPTIFFPNGLPQDITFSACSKHRFRLVAQIQDSPKRRWVMGPQQLAEVVYARANPTASKLKAIPAGFSLDRLYLYKQVRLDMTIHLGQGISAIGRVEWNEPVGSETVPIERLPREFQDAYQQELQKIQGPLKRYLFERNASS